MQNRIIVPAHYDVDIVIKYDTIKGHTQLEVKNRGKMQLTMWQIAGLLSQHAASLIQSLLNGKVNMEKLPFDATPEENKTNGGDSNAT